MSELEARLNEMRKDTATWKDAAEEMRKAAKMVADVKDLSTAFGYLGRKGQADTTYATLNDTLKSLADQADTVFRDVEGKLGKVISVYEGAEAQNKELVNRIKAGWTF
ncbi:hypothetical protein [Actinomadura rubrisoli]|uniref:Uncharacterized protein n=1 Tax=Actinomadura rubrisoli TaxID=2530368 RepID=A0A4R5C7T8_9ACTN|nr:hypothetical protein [Actinomadura rubrisoli]TDD94646.1 hypothetical protein E1298_06595 [Actinomadura rubrisoli]